MNPSFPQISRQIAALQATLNSLVLAAEAEKVMALPEAEGGRELTDDELFAIMHGRGLAAYKAALRIRNKQRTAAAKRPGLRCRP